MNVEHWVKSVKTRSFSWYLFCCNWTEYGEDLGYLSVFCLYAGKYGPEKTLYLDTFHTVEV